jgi:hypothetical protein
MKFINTFILLLIVSELNAATRFVTPSGSGLMNGTSWANAFPGTSLQTAINTSAPGDEVWVAGGTYFPTATTNREISFSMRNGVSIYGSFAGTETQLSQRVWPGGLTSILSGEIGGAGIADNSYKVIYNQLLNSTAILDGFIIRDGNDNRSPTSAGNGLGGGVYNHGFNPGGFCHPVIRNCLFTQNTASWGGGAFNNGYNGGNTQPTYIGCVFYQNHALIEAGGMDSYGVSGNASPTIFNTIFYDNTAATNVGAMYAWGGGGGNSNPVLINCVFANNRALNGYGGAFIADNLDENGITSSGSCTVTLQNCIVWNNTATGSSPQFHTRGTGAQVVATYSDIDLTGQNFPHIIAGPGTGNLNTNPMFTNIALGAGVDGNWMNIDDGLQLQNSSPCMNTGNNTGVALTDILSNNRIINSIVDLGAYEFNTIVLPVNFIDFYGKASGKSNILFWSTASEMNSRFFEIERSTSGIQFEKIGEVNAAGSSTSIRKYQFVDENVIAEKYYYRLKQMDIDGRSTMSSVILLSNKEVNNDVLVFPNPVLDKATILFKAIMAGEEFVLLNSSGQVTARLIITGNSAVLDLTGKPAGLYLLVNQETGIVYKINKVNQ